MDTFATNLHSNLEHDEDDYGNFFLQPALSPYNITEKVQQANYELFNSNNPSQMDKTTKVKFREELASYEPSELLTDDDVNSIESDQVEDLDVFCDNNNCDDGQTLEYKTYNTTNNNLFSNNLNIFDINEDEEENGEVVVHAEEEIFDETIIEESKSDDEVVGIEENVLSAEESAKNATSENVSQTSAKKSTRKTAKHQQISNNTTPIECKSHCIERIDYDLSMSIRKLEIYDKFPMASPSVACPMLKLQLRKCCDENKTKNSTNLPCYNGHRSEYGLSSAELEKRERRKEIIRLKEEKREQLMREYKNRKNQQNEAVFCQWLKDVAKRKNRKKQKIYAIKTNCSSGALGNDSNSARTFNAISNSNGSNKECLSPNIISFPTTIAAGRAIKEEEKRIRPQTANQFLPKHNIKKAKRPHTTNNSTPCVYIQVPHRMLEHGINIGDLLVTSSNLYAKKMHILRIAQS